MDISSILANGLITLEFHYTLRAVQHPCAILANRKPSDGLKNTRMDSFHRVQVGAAWTIFLQFSGINVISAFLWGNV